MNNQRTRTRMLEAATADLIAREWDEAPASEGNQRWYEAELASQHLASLSPERRAQLERESWA